MDKHNPIMYFLGAGGCLLIALHGKQSHIGAMAASLGGLILAQTSITKASERFIDDEVGVILKNTEVAKFELIAQAELTELLPEEKQAQIVEVEANTALPMQNMYDFSNLPNEGNGVLIGAGPGYGKTSMVAGYFAPLYTLKSTAEIIVLDPDSNVNRWDKWGYERTINHYDEILQCLQWFVKEKERRKSLQDYELKKEHDLILIWDEINDCRNNWSKKDKDEAARCLTILLNSRKYKITVFAMMQDANVEAIGISKKSKDQAVIILSGKAALDEAFISGVKANDERYIELSNTGYPCVVSGALSFKLAIHPTHGHHPEYERTGKPPANIIKPIISDKQIIPFAKNTNSNLKENSDVFNSEKYLDNDDELEESDDGVSEDIEGEGSSEISPTPHPHSQQLENIFNKGYSDVSPRTLIPDSWSPVSPKVGDLDAEVRGVIVNLININCPKEETIKLVFGCSKSGKSKSWKAASYWYEEIKAQVQ